MAENSLSQDQRGLPSLMSSLNRTMECPICFEDNKDLRVLSCCEKLICFPCLEKYFEDATRMSKDGPDCPLCTRTLTKKPQEYTVSKVVQHFQEYVKSLNRVVQREKAENCEMEGCRRPFDKLCKKCKKLLCYRCSLEPCAPDGTDHDTMDVRDCVAQSREEFEIWKNEKEKKIHHYELRVEEASALIRKYAQKLASTSNDSVARMTKETISLLTAAHANLVELEETRQKEELELNFQVDAVRSSSGMELVTLMEKLKTYEEKRTIILGDYENVVSGTQCFDVCKDNSGNLLIAKVGGLDVMDTQGRQLLKNLQFDGYVCIVSTVNSTILCGLHSFQDECSVVTLDETYQEKCRWEIPKHFITFTGLNDKVYVSIESVFGAKINVYSLTGEQLTCFEIAGRRSVWGLCSMLPSSLVFGDLKGHKAVKLFVSSEERTTEWSVDVPAPICLKVDSRRLTWVRSNLNDCLTILNPDGSRHQEEIRGEKFTKLGRVNGLMACEEFLCLAYEKGLAKFPITYA